jgi:8-oxo-dGTP pyrophosphatase MutT (NUDIX family)
MSRSDDSRSYLVECYWPGVSQKMLARAVLRLRKAAIELRHRGRDVNFVGSILVPADETLFCLLDGDEADVRAITEEAGIPLERVLESLWIEGNNR